MKVLHVCNSDTNGGASRAAFRIHQCLLRNGINSLFYTNKGNSGHWSVICNDNNFNKFVNLIRPKIAKLLFRFLKTKNYNLHSSSLLYTNLHHYINSTDADIVNLHWIQDEMISISDISKITKPIVWTLHDMWPFCGGEHYTNDSRWINGYLKENKPSYEKGLDINRFIWNRKMLCWNDRMHIVGPSKWLTNCAKKSVLFRNNNVFHIPYPIDTNLWSPVNKLRAKQILNIDTNKNLILFGADGGEKNLRKGFDLLVESLKIMNNKFQNYELGIFGQEEPKDIIFKDIKTHYFGKIYDSISLKIIYSSADLFAMPSRQDNLPLTCIESLACGTPVVAFNTSGLPSIISNKQEGVLVNPFSARLFSEAIINVLNNKSYYHESCHKFIKQKFSETKISDMYIDLYSKILNK